MACTKTIAQRISHLTKLSLLLASTWANSGNRRRNHLFSPGVFPVVSRTVVSCLLSSQIRTLHEIEATAAAGVQQSLWRSNSISCCWGSVVVYNVRCCGHHSPAWGHTTPPLLSRLLNFASLVGQDAMRAEQSTISDPNNQFWDKSHRCRS